MIRRGKQEGWLGLPSSALRPWAQFNGIALDGISVGSVPDRGLGVVAARALKGGDEGPLMVIPGDLVLSLERVEMQAKSDQHLRGVLEALGDYARVGPVSLDLLSLPTQWVLFDIAKPSSSCIAISVPFCL
jgi:hypothetical protein